MQVSLLLAVCRENAPMSPDEKVSSNPIAIGVTAQSAHHARTASCKACEKPITLRFCSVCDQTQDIINAVARMEFTPDGCFVTNPPHVVDGIADLRQIIAKNLASPVGWPQANRSNASDSEKNNSQS
jgi:hypothetical protein